MQKLKRKPLTEQLSDTLKNLLQPVKSLLKPLDLSPRWLTMGVLIGCCLLLLVMCSGCTPRTIRPPLPPQAEPRPMPQFTGQTFRDSILWSIEVREWGMSCEADKGAIREVYRNE